MCKTKEKHKVTYYLFVIFIFTLTSFDIYYYVRS